MPWKPIAEQFVVANLGGKVRTVLVTAWNSDSGAIKVEWPPRVQALVSPNRFSHAGKTTLVPALYEPLEPDAFKAATSG
jgi:hypothetical protein